MELCPEPPGPAPVFRALAHPARIAILDLLRAEEACVCHLAAGLGYRQAYLSQQLAVLRGAGLVQDYRDGWNVYYRVSRPQVFTLLDTARALIGVAGVPAARVTRGGVCPCPRCTPTAAGVGR